MSDDRILNRVKKMMALANDAAASDGERENALRMAYATMAKYNLEMADVEGQPDCPTPNEPRQNMSSEFYGRPWAVSLCSAVAKLFFCKYYYRLTGKNQAHHHFVGKESNATTAEEVARVLVESIRRESGRQMRSLDQNATWRRSFATGAAFKISDRVRELMSGTAALEGVSTGRALTLVNLRDQELTLNHRFLQESGVVLRVARRQASSNIAADAYSRGRTYGSGLNLSATKKLS